MAHQTKASPHSSTLNVLLIYTSKLTGTQHETPKKARLKGAFEFLTAKGIPFQKTDLFHYFKISRRSGYRILAAATVRTRHNQPDVPETRGRKRLLSETDLDLREEGTYEDEGFEAKRLFWPAAVLEAGIETDVLKPTIQRTAHSRDLYKRLAEEVESKSKADANRRLEWATAAMKTRPQPEDWPNVYFSDESHFGCSDERRAHIIRKPGTRIEPSNLQECKQPASKDEKRLHCWAAIGRDFKSPLVWYEVPANSNDKLTQTIYIKEILEPYVQKWLDEGQHFVLEEDNDSGHGPGQHNAVRAWKEKHGLDHFFSCPRSPDLSPIENAWRVPKEYVRQFPHWDCDTLKDLAEEGWKALSLSTINHWIDTMPKRLDDVIKLEGKMTG